MDVQRLVTTERVDAAVIGLGVVSLRKLKLIANIGVDDSPSSVTLWEVGLSPSPGPPKRVIHLTRPLVLGYRRL